MWQRSIDGIVWTLEVEIKFYFVCALLIAWFARKSLKVFIAPVALFLVAIYINRQLPGLLVNDRSLWIQAMNYMNGTQYVIYMFIGVVFNYLHAGRVDPNKAYLGIGGLFAIFCIHWWMGPNAASIRVAWSYAFALLAFAFAYSFPHLFKANRFFDFLADISYPVYVIHAVGGYVVLRILLDKGLPVWLVLILVTVGCVSVSWLMHVLVERPSQALGRRLAARLSSANGASAVQPAEVNGRAYQLPGTEDKRQQAAGAP